MSLLLYMGKSQYERATGRPAVATLWDSYLWNGMTNSRALIFVRCHHPINYAFDRHRYPPVPATARGTCRMRGYRRHPTFGNFTTAGPIAFKFGVCLETSFNTSQRWGASARVHVHTPFSRWLLLRPLDSSVADHGTLPFFLVNN